MAAPVSRTSVRAPSGWSTVGEAWVLSGGQWRRVAAAKAVSGGVWKETYSSTPTLTSLSFTSSTTDFTTLSVSWTYGATANCASVVLYSYPTDGDGNADTDNPTVLSATAVPNTATTASWAVSEDTFYSVTVQPHYLAPGGSTYVDGEPEELRRKVGHPEETLTVPVYGWTSDLATATVGDSGWSKTKFGPGDKTDLVGYPESNVVDALASSTWMSNRYTTGYEVSGTTVGGSAEIRATVDSGYTGFYFEAPGTLKMRVTKVTIDYGAGAFSKKFGADNLLYTGYCDWTVRAWSGPKTSLGTAQSTKTTTSRVRTANEVAVAAFSQPAVDVVYVTGAFETLARGSTSVTWTSGYPEFNGGSDNASTLEVSSNRLPSHGWYAAAFFRMGLSKVTVTYNPWGQTGTSTSVVQTQVANTSW